MSKKEFLYKILLLGDTQVGKSSFLMRYIDNTFQESYLSTVGLDFKVKNVQLDDGNTYRVQIWDTAGQDRFHAITRNYFKNAHGIILIYDVTLIESFHNVKNWIKQIKEEVTDKVSIILAGNKIDMEEKRKVSKEEGEKMAADYGLKFYECSAKTVENFSKIDEKEATKLKNKKGKKKGCC